MRLTDAGQAYAQHARGALRDLAAGERAVHDVQDLSRGQLRLAVTPTFTAYLVGPLTAELHTRHPGVALTLRETSQDRIKAGLLADEFDLGIAFRGAHLPGVTATALFAETLTLVTGGAGAGEGAVRSGPLPVRELAERRLALLSGDFATRSHIDAYLERHRVAANVTVEADSVQALTEVVQRTPLATVLPEAVTHDHPRLTPVRLDPALPTRTVALLRRADAYESAAARAFTALVHDLVQARGYTPTR